MKWNWLLRVLLLPSLLVLLNGCAVTEQIKQNYQEASESYYVPEQLNGSPQDTGILLVDAVTEKTLNTMPLSGVAIANLREPEKAIVFGSFKKGGFLSQQSNVVVIPNLQPGTYKIVKINTQNVNMWETVYMPTTKEFEVEINAGKPTYFGQIQVKHPFGSTDRKIAVRYDKNREAESWKMVGDKYSDSPWVAVINTHIKELK
jgi:hypothetical protein